MSTKYVVDFSKYQGSLNFKKVAADNYGVILRIGFGVSYLPSKQKDPKFETYYKQARETNLKIGGYYYSYAKSVAQARQEAQNCLKYLGGKTLEYPIYYDCEDAKTTGKQSASTIAKMCDAFCEEIEKAGYKAGVYASTSWFKSKGVKNTNPKYPRWEANYGKNNGTISTSLYNKPVAMHQYTSKYAGKGYGSDGSTKKVDRSIDYSTPIVDTTKKEEPKKEEPKVATTTYYINGSDGSLNIRSGRGTKYKIVNVLNNGIEIKVVDIKDGWAHLTSPVDGYCSSKYITKTKPEPSKGQTAIFPMKVLRFSSITTGAHAKCRSGNFTDKPVDLVGKDSGKDNCYAPCDIICLRVYPKASHTLWFRSVDKVKTPSGEKYLYWMCEHMSVSGFKVGNVYKRELNSLQKIHTVTLQDLISTVHLVSAILNIHQSQWVQAGVRTQRRLG